MTPWSNTAEAQPTYPVDIQKFDSLKQTIARLCSRRVFALGFDVDSYLATHLFTISLLTTGAPEPDEDLDLRFLQGGIESIVRGGQARAMPPWTFYSDVVQTSEPGTGSPLRFEVGAVLWPPNAANDAIMNYIHTFELANDDVHHFGFRLAQADAGKPLMCLERALRPDVYLNEILS